MDSIGLKFYGELLQNVISENFGKSKDVEWLANHFPLLEALEDARLYRIDSPRDLGLARWVFESNIQDFPDIAERLAEFSLLLRGWDLTN